MPTFYNKPKHVSNMNVATVKVGKINPNSCYLKNARGSRTKQVFITTVVP